MQGSSDEFFVYDQVPDVELVPVWAVRPNLDVQEGDDDWVIIEQNLMLPSEIRIRPLPLAAVEVYRYFHHGRPEVLCFEKI